MVESSIQALAGGLTRFSSIGRVLAGIVCQRIWAHAPAKAISVSVTLGQNLLTITQQYNISVSMCLFTNKVGYDGDNMLRSW